MEETTKWSATDKRKWLIGTVIFGLGALLQLLHDFVSSPFGVYTKPVEFALMLVGVAILSWAAVSWYHDSHSH